MSGGPGPAAALTVSVFSALCVTARRLGFPPGLPVCLSVNIGAFGALQHAPEPCLSSVSAARASEPNRCFLIRGLGGCLFLKRLSVTVGLILGVMCGTLPLTRTRRGSQGQRSSDTRTEAERLADPPAPLHPPGLSLSLLGWKLAEVHQARENVPGGVDANLHLISSSSGLRGEQRGER